MEGKLGLRCCCAWRTNYLALKLTRLTGNRSTCTHVVLTRQARHAIKQVGMRRL